MLWINLEFKAPATNVVRDVFIVLRNIETAALFLTCFVLGEFSDNAIPFSWTAGKEMLKFAERRLNERLISSTGTAWGYIESFLFWLIQDLGGSRSLMGITITVGGIAGIPLLALSGPIISRLGHANVIFIGFVFYAIRLLGERVRARATQKNKHASLFVYNEIVSCCAQDIPWSTTLGSC